MDANIDVRERLRAEWQRIETSLRILEDSATPDLLVERGVLALSQTAIRLDGLMIELQRSQWPEPTDDVPDARTLEAWMWDGCCEATDGCLVEPDGTCPHGFPSWFLQLGLI